MSSRRRFCSLLYAALLSAGAGPVLAARFQENEPTPGSLFHAQGRRLLLQGKRFEKAAEYFTLAAQKEPADPKHPLALGCAYAGRIASLIHAIQYREMLRGEQGGYRDSLEAWEKDRDEMRAKDPQGFNEADHEKQRPVPPPAREFLTKDDNQPVRLTDAQIGTLSIDLSAKALRAWETGIALAKTPEDLAQAYYIQGWGIRVLRQYVEQNSATNHLNAALSLSASEFIPRDKPLHETVLSAFEKATELDPTNPLYWQARGDALGENDDATEAYLKALDLKPRNATTLWYHLYRRAAPKSYEKPENEKWAIAETYLQKAKARDRGNSWPLYEQAVLRFCDAPYIMTGFDRNRSTTPEEQEKRRSIVRNAEARRNGRRAIDLILEGNSAPRYEPPRYTDSVPGLLAVAWQWRQLSFQKYDSAGFARSRELARSAGAYGKFIASEEKEREEAVRAVRAAIGMGLRLMGRWPVRDDPASGPVVMTSLVGWAVVSISYKELLSVCEILGDQDQYNAVAAESADFKMRSDGYRAIINPYLNRQWMEAY